MSNFFDRIAKVFNKSPTKVEYKLVTERGNGIYEWNGSLYTSDKIRALVRPFVTAVGKLEPKQIRGEGKDMQVNPDLYIHFLLNDPNPLLTGTKLLEKLAWQYMINNNAFALLIRDSNGYAVQCYPISATHVEVQYENGDIFLVFTLKNGNTVTHPYANVIHVPRDLCENDLFGNRNREALMPLLDVISASDKSIVSAIKNGAVVRWLLKFVRNMDDQSIKDNVKRFADSFLNIENDTAGVGVAATDVNAEAQQVQPRDYVPNAKIMETTSRRALDYFNTNEKIVSSTYTEDEWNSYYEAVIEPFARALGQEFTRKVFSRRERGFKNRIIFDATSMQYASMASKLAMVSMVDRSALTPNEWREVFNLGPLEGGDKPIRRLDTAVTSSDKNLKPPTKDDNEGGDEK